jgi:hypothetical protein
MTWYADLSDYECLPESVPAGHKGMNVGWLAPEHDFPTGDAQEDFIDELGALCAGHAYAQTRGFHECTLPHENDDDLRLTVTINGEQVALGSAEVRVAGEDDTILIAPNLIWHYVTYHRYLPPQEFIDAVLARRPGTLEVNPWDPVS